MTDEDMHNDAVAAIRRMCMPEMLCAQESLRIALDYSKDPIMRIEQLKDAATPDEMRAEIFRMTGRDQMVRNVMKMADCAGRRLKTGTRSWPTMHSVGCSRHSKLFLTMCAKDSQCPS